MSDDAWIAEVPDDTFVEGPDGRVACKARGFLYVIGWAPTSTHPPAMVAEEAFAAFASWLRDKRVKVKVADLPIMRRAV